MKNYEMNINVELACYMKNYEMYVYVELICLGFKILPAASKGIFHILECCVKYKYTNSHVFCCSNRRSLRDAHKSHNKQTKDIKNNAVEVLR